MSIKDSILTKLCEHLPLDATLFEENGICTKDALDCKHGRDLIDSTSGYKFTFCYKKTYTIDNKLQIT